MKICPDCRLEVDEKCNVCPDCGYIFNTLKKDYNKSKKNIHMFFALIVVVVIILTTIIVLSTINNRNSELSKKNDTVKRICTSGEYKEKVLITNVIDNYSCQNFVSYLIDNGINLSNANYEELIKLKNKNVYNVIYKYTGNNISKYYDKEIVNVEYFDFLANSGLFNIIGEKNYSLYLSRSLDNGDIDLFRACLRGNHSLENKYNWSGEDFYFGALFYGKTESSSSAKWTVDEMKEIVSKKYDFVREYYGYSYHDKIGAIALFSKESFENAYKGNNFDKTLSSYGYYLSYLTLDELKNYVSFGGKFTYNGKDSEKYFDEMIKEFLRSENKSDGGFVAKLNYILASAKKEGYSPKYSNLLDYFVNSYSLSQMYSKNKMNKSIYKTFANQGFKCYNSCGYVKYFK